MKNIYFSIFSYVIKNNSNNLHNLDNFKFLYSNCGFNIFPNFEITIERFSHPILFLSLYVREELKHAV